MEGALKGRAGSIALLGARVLFGACVLVAATLDCGGSARQPGEAGRDSGEAGRRGDAVHRGVEPAAQAGSVAPVSYSDLAGVQSELGRRRGRPVFVNFWATWCGPCLDEMPQLAALSREYAGAGPDFVGISVDAFVTGQGAETEQKVRGALSRAGVSYANLIYAGDQDPLVNAFHLPGPIPYSILYDRDGREARSWAGPIEVDAVRRAIAALR